MSQNDLVSDVLTRIRNGQSSGRKTVLAPSSKMIKGILEVMIREGYINGYEEFSLREGVNNVQIELKYFEGVPVIKEIKRVSKPGRRVYRSIKDLRKVFGGLGINVLSTPSGVLSDEESRLRNVGGEVICTIF